ncbi:hypothetical protein Q9233_014473 [Columba guinea]|nr:hypothetical protein Q9233_014473 [Columba guinea]
MPDLSHLTEEERKIILAVMDRQKKEEEKEQSVLNKLEDKTQKNTRNDELRYLLYLFDCNRHYTLTVSFEGQRRAKTTADTCGFIGYSVTLFAYLNRWFPFSGITELVNNVLQPQQKQQNEKEPPT